jgi:hypothetical protein
MTWANFTGGLEWNNPSAVVNQTQAAWGSCSGGRIGYDDPTRVSPDGYGCGYYAEQHGSWCDFDGGWGDENCCRCEEGWMPSHPGQYGYFDLFGADCNNFGNCTNATNGTDHANTPSTAGPPTGFFDGTGSNPSDPCWQSNTCTLSTAGPPTSNFDGTGSDINDPCWQTQSCMPSSTPSTTTFDGTGSHPSDPCWQAGTCTPGGAPTTGNQCNDNSWPADKYGDGCDKYVMNRSWCSGQYDDSDFSDRDCCACADFYGL